MEAVVYASRRESGRDAYTWEGTSVRDKSIMKDRELMKTLLFRMAEARGFDLRLLSLFAEGRIYGTMHPCVGEEAADIGTTAAMEPRDKMFATHRGHGQTIGKGVDIREMMCEMMARENGPNRGRGGSMHLADIDRGILGANGILGASAPLACGAALALKMDHNSDTVIVDFFGDGSSNQGAGHESMNLAAAWKLPLMFVLLNNTYGMSTPLDRAVNDLDLTKRALPYGMKAFECDGNDVLAVYETVKEAREYILTRGEPVLVVEHTYRTSGHSKSDKNLYRSREEIDLWLGRNPTERFKKLLLEKGVFSAEEIDAICEEAEGVIEDAVKFAESSPAPSPESVLDNVWAD